MVDYCATCREFCQNDLNYMLNIHCYILREGLYGTR